MIIDVIKSADKMGLFSRSVHQRPDSYDGVIAYIIRLFGECDGNGNFIHSYIDLITGVSATKNPSAIWQALINQMLFSESVNTYVAQESLLGTQRLRLLCIEIGLI